MAEDPMLRMAAVLECPDPDLRRLAAQYWYKRLPEDEMVARVCRLDDQRRVAQESVQKLGHMLDEAASTIDRLTEPPHITAYVEQLLCDGSGRPIQAQVRTGGNALHWVVLGPDVDPAALEVSDEVALGANRNVILRHIGPVSPSGGDVLYYVGPGPDELVVVAPEPGGGAPGRQTVAALGPQLAATQLATGDRLVVRNDRVVCILPREESARSKSTGRDLMRDPDQVAGYEDVKDEIRRRLRRRIANNDIAAKYRGDDRDRPDILLFHGPPGTGKTLLASAIARLVESETGRPSVFWPIQPGEFESMWYGESPRKVGECFDSIRELVATTDTIPVLFIEEADQIGRSRGGLTSRASDDTLTRFLAELDGINAVGRCIVVLATNRRSAMDPALLSRVNRQFHFCVRDARMAAEICRVHLPATAFAAADRDQCIEAGIEPFFEDTPLATVKMSTEETIPLHARDLVSGRDLAEICMIAKDAAYDREVAGGAPGITPADLRAAALTRREDIASAISKDNARDFLPDLPQDARVVAVDRVTATPAAAALDYIIIDPPVYHCIGA